VLVGKPEFAAGAWPFAFVMLGLALASPWQPFNQLLLMAKRPGIHTLMTLLVFGVAFAANYFLIPMFGLSGAGIAMATAAVAGCALLVIFARKTVGVRL
jgi:O-antigen/teichoic acid export membrane protein